MGKRFFCIIAAALLLALAPCTVTASGAEVLFEADDEFIEPSINNGPWIYQSQTLTVIIRKATKVGQLHYVADIYIREGETPYTGWANMTPPGNATELPHITARKYGAVFGLTGDYIAHRGNDKGVMIRDGEVYYDKPDADVLAVFPSGEMEVYMKGTVTAEELTSQGVRDSLAFGPIILMDGEMTEAVYTHNLKPKNVRTGIGKVEDGHYIAIVSRGQFTFPEFAQVFLDYGCKWAFNLDGGHSASMIIMGEQVNGHSLETLYEDVTVRQRPISDMLLIGKSELTPGPDEPAIYEGSR